MVCDFTGDWIHHLVEPAAASVICLLCKKNGSFSRNASEEEGEEEEVCISPFFHFLHRKN